MTGSGDPSAQRSAQVNVTNDVEPKSCAKTLVLVQLADEQLRRPLVSTDFAECDHSWPETMRLLHAISWHRAACARPCHRWICERFASCGPLETMMSVGSRRREDDLSVDAVSKQSKAVDFRPRIWPPNPQQVTSNFASPSFSYQRAMHSSSPDSSRQTSCKDVEFVLIVA